MLSGLLTALAQETVADSAIEAKAIAGHGEIGKGRNRGVIHTSIRGSGNVDYLTARIKRDRPDILARVGSSPNFPGCKSFRLAKQPQWLCVVVCRTPYRCAADRAVSRRENRLRSVE